MKHDPAFLSKGLPQFLKRRIPQLGGEAYQQWPVAGAVLFVDLVGFTEKVEKLIAIGGEAAELTNELLNRSIGEMVDAFTQADGDVVVFAGDALVVLWPRHDEEAGLGPAVRRAVSAALAELSQTRVLRDRSGADQPITLARRMSLGASALTAHRLGGYDGRWQVLLSGEAMDQVTALDGLARNECLLLSDQAWASDPARLRGHRLEVSGYRVHGVRSAADEPRHRFVDTSLATADLRPYVPRHWEAAGVVSGVADFRQPSVIFVRLIGLNPGGRLQGPRAHAAAQDVQRVLAELDGSLLQFAIDDKGPVFVIAFGLLGRVHEDDPVRASLAALRIGEAMAAREIDCGIGVATGRSFSGLVGGQRRHHYSLCGLTMNLAARLMQESDGTPLFDQLTVARSQDRIDYRNRGELSVKGLDQPIRHYLAQGERRPARAAQGQPGAHTRLVGRAREVGILSAQLQQLQQEGDGGVVALIGEAGIGKSRLLSELLIQAHDRGLHSFMAAAGATGGGAQARWRPMLRSLLAAQSGRVIEDEAYLRAFCGEQAPPPDRDDEQRAARTREAMARLILGATRRQPTLICVEDAHWMDSLSWSLVARLARAASESGSRLMLIVTARELETVAPQQAMAALTRSGMLRIRLGPLSAPDQARVAASVLGVERLPRPFMDWLAGASGGNPLFCRELSVAAVERGQLRLDQGHALLQATPESMVEQAALPQTLQGVIASRLDRLSVTALNHLRLAAVIGSRFRLEALKALSEDAGRDLPRTLDSLRRGGFLDRADQAGDYVFHHALIRDAAYDSLPYRMRRQLHRRIAEWMQRQPGSASNGQSARLAHHWTRAECWPQAFDANLRAGDAALQQYSNREAAEHFRAARSIRTHLPKGHGLSHSSGPEQGLACALHRMGQERESRSNIEMALRMSGEKLPQRRITQLLGIVGEICWRFVPPSWRKRLMPIRVEHLRARVMAFDQLPEILYYDNDPLALTYASLRFLRLTETEADASAEHARALGSMALIQSGLGRRQPVEQRFDSALEVARTVGDAGIDAWLRLARGSTLAQFGDWDAAEQWLRDAQTRCESLGDRSRWWNVTSGLGHVLSYRGDLRSGAQVLSQAASLNRDTDNPLFLAWGLTGHAEVLHRQGRAQDRDAVLHKLREARQAIQLRPDASVDLFNRGIMAAALWRAGNADEALELTRQTIEQGLHRAPTVWLQVGAFLGLLEVLHGAADDPALHSELRRLTRQLLARLRGFSRLMRIGGPVYCLARANLALIDQRRARARRIIALGLKQARELRLPLEYGRLSCLMASTVAAPRALDVLEDAAQSFERIGAQYDAQAARAQIKRLACLVEPLAACQVDQGGQQDGGGGP